MKITKLHIEGFRSLRDVTWSPGDLNVVIGSNGSGKSNLLAFLEMMAISAKGGWSKYIQSSGGMDAVVWDGRASEICCGIASVIAPSLDAKFGYKLQLARIGNGSSYRIEKERLFDYLDGDKDDSQRTYLSNFKKKATFVDEKGQFQVIPASFLSDDESVLSMLRLHGNEFLMEFQRQIASIVIYRAFNTNADAPIRQSAITRMEQCVDPDGQNLISVLHTLYTGDRDFKNDINLAMRTAFGDDFDELVFPPAADQRIQLRVRWKSLKREQSAADLSDGTLRFLYLLAILASPNPPPVIAIDEPETGLHPSMLPVIAEFAIDASKRAQVIITTDSPQMLDAFGDTRPTTTVAQWQNGETSLRTIKDADLDYWLKEYTLGALFKSGELEQMA